MIKGKACAIISLHKHVASVQPDRQALNLYFTHANAVRWICMHVTEQLDSRVDEALLAHGYALPLHASIAVILPVPEQVMQRVLLFGCLRPVPLMLRLPMVIRRLAACM